MNEQVAVLMETYFIFIFSDYCVRTTKHLFQSKVALHFHFSSLTDGSVLRYQLQGTVRHSHSGVRSSEVRVPVCPL